MIRLVMPRHIYRVKTSFWKGAAEELAAYNSKRRADSVGDAAWVLSFIMVGFFIGQAAR